MRKLRTKRKRSKFIFKSWAPSRFRKSAANRGNNATVHSRTQPKSRWKSRNSFTHVEIYWKPRIEKPISISSIPNSSFKPTTQTAHTNSRNASLHIHSFTQRHVVNTYSTLSILRRNIPNTSSTWKTSTSCSFCSNISLYDLSSYFPKFSRFAQSQYDPSFEKIMPSYRVSCCVEHNLTFKTLEELHKHMRDHHYELSCDICERPFPNAAAKRLHDKYTHNSERK